MALRAGPPRAPGVGTGGGPCGPAGSGEPGQCRVAGRGWRGPPAQAEGSWSMPGAGCGGRWGAVAGIRLTPVFPETWGRGGSDRRAVRPMLAPQVNPKGLWEDLTRMETWGPLLSPRGPSALPAAHTWVTPHGTPGAPEGKAGPKLCTLGHPKGSTPRVLLGSAAHGRRRDRVTAARGGLIGTAPPGSSSRAGTARMVCLAQAALMDGAEGDTPNPNPGTSVSLKLGAAEVPRPRGHSVWPCRPSGPWRAVPGAGGSQGAGVSC